MNVRRRQLLQTGVVSAISVLLSRSSQETIARSVITLDHHVLSAGRLIFRGTRSTEGQVVRWFDRQNEFTHVGILTDAPNAADRWEVIHANPDHNHVSREPLTAFLTAPGIFSAAVFGWNLPAFAREADLAAQASQWIGIPFDADFAWDTGAVYCTELVWKAAQALSWVHQPKTSLLRTPWGTREVLLISDLLSQLPIQRLQGPSDDTPHNPSRSHSARVGPLWFMV